MVAHDVGEDHGGIAGFVLGGGAGAEAGDVVAFELGVRDVVALGFEEGGGVGALDVYAGPVAAVFFGEFDELLEVDVAGGGEDHVAGAVAGIEVVFHLGLGEGGDGFLGAEDGGGHGVGAEVVGHDGFEEDVGGAVEVEGDFFEDDFLFHVEVVGAEGGAHHVGEEGEAAFGEFGEDLGPVASDFVGGEGVVLGAHGVEFFVDLLGVEGGGAFEHHVFEEVGDAGDVGGFVARAGFHHEADGGGVGGGVDLGDDVEAVFELGLFELESHSMITFS